jgi:hypothetical protein
LGDGFTSATREESGWNSGATTGIADHTPNLKETARESAAAERDCAKRIAETQARAAIEVLCCRQTALRRFGTVQPKKKVVRTPVG